MWKVYKNKYLNCFPQLIPKKLTLLINLFLFLFPVEKVFFSYYSYLKIIKNLCIKA